MPDADGSWTTRRLLRWMSGHFEAHDVDAPRVVAEMLLAHVIGCDRMRLYMEADRPATTEERERLRELVRRAARHEPVQYLVGKASFFSFELAVDDSTLIPQPCTEDLVTRVLEHLAAHAPGSDSGVSPRVADIGTGSGCIAIAVARQHAEARIVATDIEARALDLARRNAESHGLDARISFQAGDGLAPLAAEEPFDVICSNPPYIPDCEWNDDAAVQRCIREFVPETATRGGRDGLDVIRPLLERASAHLRPGGLLVVEIADVLRDEVLKIARAQSSLADAEVIKDSEGYWRFLTAHATAGAVPAAGPSDRTEVA